MDFDFAIGKRVDDNYTVQMDNNEDRMTRICLDDAENFQKHLCFFKVVPDIAANDFGYLAFAAHMHSAEVNYRRFQKMSL